METFLEEQPDKKLKPVMTPVTNYLFKTHVKVVNKIPKQKSGLFHAMFAKVLIMVKRASPNILLVVSFLTTRVKNQTWIMGRN
jgi:hypothetical protein